MKLQSLMHGLATEEDHSTIQAYSRQSIYYNSTLSGYLRNGTENSKYIKSFNLTQQICMHRSFKAIII